MKFFAVIASLLILASAPVVQADDYYSQASVTTAQQSSPYAEALPDLPGCTIKCPSGNSLCKITCAVGKSAECYLVNANFPDYCHATCACK